ncbi:MAG: alpha/beta hydrolase fold domain-containing protein [Selenomonadaceae bacterium]|nr:alpha/beta hydrolase fold domain-containing protein [Selenomonadaceae bacterium]
MKIYKEILSRGISPEKIIVIGDSAGGNLALALSVALKEKNIPQPKLMILISAWGTVEKNLSSRKLNENRDLVLGKNFSPLYNEVCKYSSYAKNFNKKNPNLSPIYADFTGFPTMLIQAGGYEILLNDSIEIAKKAATADVKFTLTIYPEMPHDFALMLPTLQDSLDSFKEIQDFINQNMND